jgi:hypothetical protein
MIQAFHPFCDKVSELMILPMPKFNETRKEDTMMLFEELLCNLGTLKEIEDRGVEFVNESV